jgi:release factor glutamine methyltransferase
MSGPNSPDPQPLTVVALLQKAADYLAAHGVEPARLTAEWLAAEALGCRRLDLYLRFDQPVTEEARMRIRSGLTRLGNGEPVQYVLGTAEFMTERVRVDRRVLIPRPETEQLVEGVLATPVLAAHPAPTLADIGTGSGCIALALARAWPAATIWAVDCSLDALAVAAENIRRAPAPGIHLLAGDLLSGFRAGSLDGVIANLPYIATAECDRLPRNVRDFEPRMALDGGLDGLDGIRRLAEQARTVLRPGGVLWLEIGSGQGAAVRIVLEGYESVAVLPDYAGRERRVRAFRPPAK